MIEQIYNTVSHNTELRTYNQFQRYNVPSKANVNYCGENHSIVPYPTNSILDKSNTNGYVRPTQGSAMRLVEMEASISNPSVHYAPIIHKYDADKKVVIDKDNLYDFKINSETPFN
jgi:hypothetical protein